MDFSTNKTSPLEEVQFQAEKNLMRQFMMLKDEGHVPSYITMTHMKNWLISGRDFWQECQDVATENDLRKLYLTELTWYSKRRLELDEMEQELCNELNNEHRLSQQFGREVTMEGLQMFLQKIRPALEEDVQRILLPVYAGFPHSIMVVQEDKSDPENTVDGSEQKPKLTNAMFLQGAQALFPEIVTLVLKHLLEKPVEASTPAVGNTPSQFMQPMIARLHSIEKRIEVREVTNLVEKAAAEFLCQFGNVPMPILSAISKAVSGDIVHAVYSKFEEASKSFNLIGFDGTSFDTRFTVQNAVYDMTCMRAASQMTVIPKQSVVLEATVQKVITEVLLQINPDTFANKDVNLEVSALMGNVFELLNSVPWVQVTAVEELANLLLQSADVFKFATSIVKELKQVVGSWDNSKKVVANGHLDKHIAYMVAINIGRCVPDKYSTSRDELQITQRIMESVKIPFPIISGFESNTVEDLSNAIEGKSDVDNTQKQGLVEVQADPTIKDVVKEEENFIWPKSLEYEKSINQLLDAAQVEKKTPEHKIIKEEEDVTMAHSSEHECLKQLDQISKEDTLDSKVDHVKAEAATLTLVSVDTQVDQTIKPGLASEPTELKLEVYSGVPAKCSGDGYQLQKKKQKKGGICGFFRGVWKVITCSTGIPNEEE